MNTLENSLPNVYVRVVQIKDNALKPKLLEMGFYVGKLIRVVFKAPFGDPIAVDLGSYVLSMRKDEAALVVIEEEIK